MGISSLFEDIPCVFSPDVLFPKHSHKASCLCLGQSKMLLNSVIESL